MTPIRFVIEGGRIKEVEVGDYKFKCRDIPESAMSMIESLFRQLIDRGVLFVRKRMEPNEIRKLVASLTTLQKVVLKLFEGREKVSWSEIEETIKSNLSPGDRSKNIGLIWAGVSAGITRKARKLGILDKDEPSFIWNSVDETYELNSKLKPICGGEKTEKLF